MVTILVNGKRIKTKELVIIVADNGKDELWILQNEEKDLKLRFNHAGVGGED